jgi:hypothetical protein
MNQLPGWYSGKCNCGRDYFVFNRSSADLLACNDELPVEGLEQAARDEAARLNYVYVNAAIQPFLLCGCGALIHVLPCATASEMVM